MAPAAEQSIEPYPLYNTTFTLHRVSPLYTGSNLPLDNTTLQRHARRFRDILAGDVLRGVRVGLGTEDDVHARVGALQSVTWQVLVEEDLWNMDEETTTKITMGHGAGKGMMVQVAYEKMLYRAILLGHQGSGQDESMLDVGQDGFQHFPLLLTRMPASLREMFTDFLATTFDARVAILHLTGPYLPTTFERYISDCCMGGDGEEAGLVESSKSLRKTVKDVQVLIGFDLPNVASLQTIEFHLSQEDIPRLVHHGKKIGDMESPFMNALSGFVKTHLALDLKHEKIRILRIACGAFVLGAEGRIKLTEPTVQSAQMRSTWNLVDGLIGIAKGGGMGNDAT
ncbi:hypothetical protein D0Z07_8406 [Hyphodiscus hymeniophilus]|uniref:Uncharacterized protein n=1 Tax=Hyphodiscus hymeniophilus TaxID=353542 RepID=A0A9P6VEC1_9HELO|nr:hypothetical protein D0Z07_8406 [Hyphodiscus hymeniophilus]